MASNVQKAFINDVEYTEKDFASYQEKVFGSTGTFSYNTRGRTILVQGGGLLMGGYFYKITGEVGAEVPANETKYVIARKTKGDESAPRFTLSGAPAEDDEKEYAVTLFKLVASANSLEVDRISGYSTALYKTLHREIVNTVKVHSGTGNPAASLGKDGDVYIKY